MQYTKLFTSDYNSRFLDVELNSYLESHPEHKIVSVSYSAYMTGGGEHERLMVVFEKDDEDSSGGDNGRLYQQRRFH